MFSAEVPDSARPGRGPARRAPNSDVVLTLNGAATLFENFRGTVEQHRERPCTGFRRVDPKTGEAGPFVWSSYGQVYRDAIAFGSGLIGLGLAVENDDGMPLLGFFAKNRPEWMTGEQGCYAYGVVPVPLYDTLGAEAVEHAVKLTGVATIACSSAEVPVLLDAAVRCSILRNIVVMGPGSDDPSLLRLARDLGVKLLSFDDVRAHGARAPLPLKPSSPTDPAFFCFTSGTTGQPKGAIITHQNLLSTGSGVQALGLKIVADDVHLSYLPLPHVFERLIQMLVISGGGSIGYFQGDTLKILDDLAALRPTLFPSVPRLLNRVYDKILAGVQEAGGVKGWLFNRALRDKVTGLRDGHLSHALWDRLVFGPLKKRLGFDRLRLMATGSAPIAGHVMDFLRAVFGVPVLEGYGQTESAAIITLTLSDDFSVGHVGIPAPCCEVMLEDVPEMGYLSSDTRHGADKGEAGTGGEACMGRGEICFRGPNVFASYYKMPEKTAETVDDDGWCHTGDIGLWTADGKLKIIDRKKNIFKLSQGEYVAAEKVENVLTRSSFVLQSFVYGDSLRSHLVAIIVPDPETVGPWAKKKGLPVDAQVLCGMPELNAAILEDIKRHGKAAGLKGFEVPRAIHLSPDEFSVDNGILTPTFKLKRPAARRAFQAEIDRLYSGEGMGITRSKL